MPHQEPDMLEQLQTPQQVELLGRIDKLRSDGLGHHGISLPQLIVCGEQSSGKSSLLERLTRLRFPTGDNMCTKFATEVVLRNKADVEIMCTITPSEFRSDAEKRRLSKFRQKFSSPENFDFKSVTEEAKDQMECGVKENNKLIFGDVLRVRYSGPELPSLTIVDLPGFIETDTVGGHAVNKINELVTGYMRDEKSIVLAIVHSGSDVQCQKVFTHLKTFDPTHSRTLGILTKPDRLESGSQNEEEMVKLVRNEGYLQLQHGWHAVSNRNFGAKDPSLEERDEAERKFFSNGIWSSLHPADVGISSLRVKLSRVLLEHIGRELPSLVKAVQDAAVDTEAGLKSLGISRGTTAQQREYLAGHAQTFLTLTNDALRGFYGNPFFTLSSPDRAAITRLRTKVQNLNIAFAQTMYTKGHTWNIDSTQQFFPPVSRGSCSEVIQEYSENFSDPVYISRKDFLDSHIGTCVRNSRQAGLLSLVNPSVVGDIFRLQSDNWGLHAKYHLQRVFAAMTDYVTEALGSLMDPFTCNMLMLKQVSAELESRRCNAEAKLEELLLPYTEQEPISYDPNFVHQLDVLRKARYAMQDGVQENSQAQFRKPAWFTHNRSNQDLLTESVDEHTNSDILDLMQTYYNNAISVFISNIAVLGIENCLMKDLSDIFSPKLVIAMNDDLLCAIASEPQKIRDERTRLKKKLSVLQAGKQVLSEHMAMHSTTRTSKARSAVSRTKGQPVKPHLPSNRHEDTQARKAATTEVDDLVSGFGNFAVTPPKSSYPDRPHTRVDSGTSTPIPQQKTSRNPSPYGQPRNFNIPPVTVEDASDSDEF